MGTEIKKINKISPSLVFYLIHSMQIGVSILTFESSLAKAVEQDAWAVVLVSGLLIHVIIYLMYKLLSYKETSLIAIHTGLFKPFIGNGLTLIFLLYYLGIGILVIRIYIEIVQVWVFPEWKTWSFGLIFVLLIYSIISGGFRSVVGMAFFGVIIPIYLIFTLFLPIHYAHYTRYLPIMNHTMGEMFNGVFQAIPLFIGISTLLFYYPFINEPRKSQKWAHMGNLFSTVLYLAVTLITTAYYGSEQLKRLIYPSLGVWKIVELPFAERFEFIGVASWLFVIIPNCCVPIWCIGYSFKQMFKMQHRVTLVLVLLVIYPAVILLKTHTQIEMFSSWVTRFGMGILFGYVPFLTVIQVLKNKWGKKA
ncbi:GerAB/ArcD/ProY family transporter [Pullulanibacillus sp. KACC 23026]|uniref:GerAB/ArcD/ProY family transporter n=1 Tax=Pullulanibacillus sp. KACC 23026 TaxID=3028315 RepID=UPI0023B12007|nr:GerAB/ArcD/ProY family transporter [Pullulanibacillus sp. KACC 23026]WEG13224.1 GerAB/ArcD/ProY family transporter [Pullulanibacillus sp. KACC 23026]